MPSATIQIFWNRAGRGNIVGDAGIVFKRLRSILSDLNSIQSIGIAMDVIAVVKTTANFISFIL